MIYSIDTIPPFYEDDKVFADFQNLFYSISIFEEWKKSIGNTSLIFEDFSNTKVFDGVVVSKTEDERLAKLAKNMTRQMTILLWSLCSMGVITKLFWIWSSAVKARRVAL